MVQMFRVFTVTSVLASSLLFGMSVGEINKASKEELMEIKGIGMAKADAIMKQRAVMPFKNMADVEAVKGVGPALVKNMENNVHKKETTKAKERK